MIDEATKKRLARHWEDGWNACDLDIIMEPYAKDVLFTSPGVAKVTGDPTKTTIQGYDPLRAYIAESLEKVTGISYTLDETFVGTDSVVLLYTVYGPEGRRGTGADSMRVDADNNIVEWRCHYPKSLEL
jgi:hypothetical protein